MRPAYCSQPSTPSCAVCSLNNYGRDCRNNIIMPRCKCKRCRNEWTPRTAHPVRCPECKSQLWDTERVRARRKLE